MAAHLGSQENMMSQVGPRRGRLGPGFTPGHMTFLTAVSHTVKFKGMLTLLEPPHWQ